MLRISSSIRGGLFLKEGLRGVEDGLGGGRRVEGREGEGEEGAKEGVLECERRTERGSLELEEEGGLEWPCWVRWRGCWWSGERQKG